MNTYIFCPNCGILISKTDGFFDCWQCQSRFTDYGFLTQNYGVGYGQNHQPPKAEAAAQKTQRSFMGNRPRNVKIPQPRC
jgi:uncharacterized protein YecT (DUF1311 family)